MWKPYKRVTVTLGYGGNFTRGYSNFFNQPQFGSSRRGRLRPRFRARGHQCGHARPAP